MAEVGKLSLTKITTYKGCSMAYFLKYIAHENVPTNVRFVFGKSIHYFAKRFYKINYKSAESFSNAWKYYWSSNIEGKFLKGQEKVNLEKKEFELKNGFVFAIGNHVDLGPEPVGVFFGYRKLGEKILKRFYARHIPEKDPNNEKRNVPFGIEKSFGVKKSEPLEIGGYPIRGVFDRIDKTNKGYIITDYKTDKTSPKPKSFTLHRNIQFTLYSCAFRKLFGEEEERILYYHLRSGSVLETHRSEKDYDYLKRLLDEVAYGISNDNFVPFYCFNCNLCDYMPACEKYSLPYHGGPKIIDLEGRIKPAKEFKDWDIDVPEWAEFQEAV